MRLKLDENLPVAAVSLLNKRGYDVDTVREEGLGGKPDDAVWRAAHPKLGALRRSRNKNEGARPPPTNCRRLTRRYR